MSKYDVNIRGFGLLLTPTMLRKPVMMALVYAALSPLVYLFSEFRNFRKSCDYRLYHNGQICYLRAVLNDYFDPLERRITISEVAGNASGLMVYLRNEDKSVLVPMRDTGRAIIVNRRGFGGVGGYDFWINIPLSLYDTIDVQRLRAVANVYKLASKRFAINYI